MCFHFSWFHELLSLTRTVLHHPSVLVTALSDLSSLPISPTRIFFSRKSCWVFREPSLPPCHLLQLLVVCMALSPVSARSSYLRLRWLVCPPFLRGLKSLLPQQIWSFPHLAASLGDPGGQARTQGSRTRKCHLKWEGEWHPPIPQGPAPQQTDCAQGSTQCGRPQAPVLGKWQELILFFKLLLFSISCYGITAAITFLERLEHATGSLSSLWATDS